MSDYQLLEWDSTFFGFPVAKIMPARLSEERLAAILDELKAKGTKLVYWPSDSGDEGSGKAAEVAGGFLGDRKTTYTIGLDRNEQENVELALITERYLEGAANKELKHLALMSGMYSRYNLDPRISQKQFEDLYSSWIERSVDRIMADAVFVVRFDGKIMGMATVGEKEGRGDIGLLAVDVPARRKGLGRMLVAAAKSWFASQGYSISQVVTQKRNIPACRLYETCGYTVEKVENYYHFWL